MRMPLGLNYQGGPWQGVPTELTNNCRPSENNKISDILGRREFQAALHQGRSPRPVPPSTTPRHPGDFGAFVFPYGTFLAPSLSQRLDAAGRLIALRLKPTNEKVRWNVSFFLKHG